jgi:hypothetical protein
MKKFLYFNTKLVDRITKPTATTKEQVGLLTSSTVAEALNWSDLNNYFLRGNIPDVIACGVSQIIDSDPKDFLSSMHEDN